MSVALVALGSFAYDDDALNSFGEPKREEDVWGRGEQGAALVHGVGCLCLGCQCERHREAENRRYEEEERRREEEEYSRRRQFVQVESGGGLDIPAGLSMPRRDIVLVNERRRQQEEAQRRAHEEYERTRPSQVFMRVTIPVEKALFPSSRIWTDHRGKKFSAKWVGMDADFAYFILVSDKTGKRYKAMYPKFSKQDQKYLDEQVAWYTSQGFTVHHGWWYKVREVEAKDVKNGGFPSCNIDQIDYSP